MHSKSNNSLLSSSSATTAAAAATAAISSTQDKLEITNSFSTTTTARTSNVTDLGPPPPMSVTMTNAAFYVLSGCSQPLIMTLCKAAGLADSSCQLYMVFYYLGPASVTLSLIQDGKNTNTNPWPSQKALAKTCGIALFDIGAQTMNYTGASLAGPTIFAIVYSSVTVWTAVFSQVFLQRSMNVFQWMGCFVVFGGLVLTATDSLELGQDVITGLCLVLAGSAMHSLTYIMSEGIMTITDEKITIKQNCAIQGIVATTSFSVWQLIYTIPRFEERIWQPMQDADTSIGYAMSILGMFAIANLIHGMTFFHTLRNFPGGATSAGVMKGLQAVLVFVFTHFAYCGKMGGEEMCFSSAKFTSLITVTGGVIGYVIATQERAKTGSKGANGGYEQIQCVDELI